MFAASGVEIRSAPAVAMMVRSISPFLDRRASGWTPPLLFGLSSLS
jgi:hypothetical protein